ncbi:mevalonate kinase, partial [Patescibacteria group bacterium]|nr:mevalonate kinase [Patescibacteria group bacterium]
RFGFGSSSASVVCVIKAMSELFNLNLSPKEIFDLSYKTVLDVQGAGSGFDVAAAVYGGTVYFIKGGITIEQLNISNLPLIIGYSGIKTDTVTLINQVKEKAEKYPKIIEGIYSSIEELVELAKVKLLANDLRSFGELMNINQGYLDALGVSINKLADMIYASRIAGAYGAKLSGAGGGDCIIAIAPEEKRISVEKAIQQAGGEVIKVKTNAKGVKVE